MKNTLTLKGFTLIELLVVIAIVAITLSLIFGGGVRNSQSSRYEYRSTLPGGAKVYFDKETGKEILTR